MTDPLRLTTADHLSILNLEAEYARRWDTKDAAGWAALFHERGVFRTVGVGKLASLHFEGHDELSAFCRETNDEFEGLHLIHTPAVEIAGDEGRGWSHFEFQSSRTHGQTGELNRVTGIYSSLYSRSGAGWRITRRAEQVVTINGRQFYPAPATLDP